MIPGVTDRPKTNVYEHERIYKACHVLRVKPETVILGSSRANFGLSPEHPGWRHRPVYNLGISGGSIEYIDAFFQHACANGSIKEALILLDYASPSLAGSQLALPEQFWLDTCHGQLTQSRAFARLQQSLWSWDALKAGLEQCFGPQASYYYKGNGWLDNEAIWQARLKERALMSDNPWPKGFDLPRPPFTGVANQGRDWNYLRSILALAADRNIKVSLVISPIHDLLWKRYIDVDGMDTVLEWRREILATLDAEGRRSGRPAPLLWDFALNPWSAMSPEALDSERGGNVPLFLESSHFSVRVGDRLLDRVLLDLPGPDPAMGIRLTSSNVERQLETLRKRWQP